MAKMSSRESGNLIKNIPGFPFAREWQKEGNESRAKLFYKQITPNFSLPKSLIDHQSGGHGHIQGFSGWSHGNGEQTVRRFH
jgi:hypothetical protein